MGSFGAGVFVMNTSTSEAAFGPFSRKQAKSGFAVLAMAMIYFRDFPLFMCK